MTMEELDRLLALEDGDAALVFLCGKRGREPQIGETRMAQARKKLGSAGMLPSSFIERPSYSAGEIAQSKLTDPGFRAVVDEAERLMGKALSPSDLQTLHSIRHWRGLPSGVMLMLLHYCAGEKKYITSMKQVDKEAGFWEKEGIDGEAEAERFITRKEASREATAKIYKRIGIFGREPGATEKRYVASWVEMGFSPEAIAIAYDKTTQNAGWPAWAYCDKIIRRWHENGWHTPEQIERNDKKTPAVQRNEAAGSYERNKEALRRVKGEGR